MVRTRSANESTCCRAESTSLTVAAIGCSPESEERIALPDAPYDPYYYVPLTASFARLFRRRVGSRPASRCRVGESLTEAPPCIGLLDTPYFLFHRPRPLA